MSNIVVQQLPECFRSDQESNEISTALTDGISDFILTIIDDLEHYEERYLDPRTCKDEWLDYLAYQLGWQGIWQSTWASNIKRQLLINTTYIWANRGSRDILPYLLSIFELQGNLKQATGWILGVTEMAVDLTTDPFSYQLEIPRSYTANSRQFKLIELLIQNFIPCWVEIEIIRV